MATLKNTVIQGASNYVSLPNQTVSTATGTSKLRYNTANPGGTGGGGALEFFDGTAWRPVTGFSPGLVGTGGNSITYQHGSIVHMFTSTGGATFTPAFTGNVQVLVVGGGGSSGYDWAAGGGGGGVIMNRSFPVTSGTPYPVNVGAGGAGRSPTVAAPNGGNSVFSSITASGGGGGGSWAHSSPGSMDNGSSGGRTGASGGGGANTGDGVDSRRRSYGGMGTAGQGFPGGSGLRFNVDIENTHQGGAGGGAGGPGGSAPDGRQSYRGSFRNANITGGQGRASDILGSGATLYYAGGGGGGGHLGWGFSDGGIGGGGGGSHHHGGPYGGTIKQSFGGGYGLNDGQSGQPTARGGHGGANTGGGAGGGQHGADGGSGVVIIKY